MSQFPNRFPCVRGQRLWCRCLLEDLPNRGFQAAGASAGTGVFGNRAYIQVRINTTDYFLDPDNVGNDGIPGAASPYPRSTNFQPCFNLYPDVYVLPGQVFDALVTCYNY